MIKKCYNCRLTLDTTNYTGEHVPPQNLFDGFPTEYKLNRIVVPACKDCNHLFSKIDNEIRDVLAVKTEDIKSREKLASKGIRSISRNKNWLDRVTFDANGNVRSINFKYKSLLQSHLKNFKGIFYYKYGFPITDEFDIEIIADEKSFEKFRLTRFIFDYLNAFCSFEVSGHEDIFKFKIGDMTLDRSDNFYVSNNITECSAVVSLLIYHNEVIALAFAGKHNFLHTCLNAKK